jgi:lysophospholipase L1-like esterase
MTDRPNPQPIEAKRPSSKPGRWKRLCLRSAFSLAVFLLCGVVLEIILRLCGYGNLEIYEPDPRLYWKLKPNQNCYTKVDHKPVHINSHGTRGPEFQIAKPAGTVRVLCIGDSRTFGWGLSESETYSGRLRQLLQEKIGNSRKVEVINAGVNAWSYPQMSVYFREIASQFQPDVVILGDANGWTQFSEKNNPEFLKKVMSRVRLKNFVRHFAVYHYFIELKLKEFYERNRVKFIPVDPNQDPFFKEQQQTNPNTVFREAMEQLCAFALQKQIQPVLLYMPTLDNFSATNAPADLQTKRELSQKLNIPVVDVSPALRAGANSFYLDADPVHLNAAGNEIIARELYDCVSSLPIFR